MMKSRTKPFANSAGCDAPSCQKNWPTTSLSINNQANTLLFKTKDYPIEESYALLLKQMHTDLNRLKENHTKWRRDLRRMKQKQKGLLQKQKIGLMLCFILTTLTHWVQGHFNHPDKPF